MRHVPSARLSKPFVPGVLLLCSVACYYAGQPCAHARLQRSERIPLRVGGSQNSTHWSFLLIIESAGIGWLI